MMAEQITVMTGAELLAWQGRHFGQRRGAQTTAARYCGVPRASWYHMLAGRMAVPALLERFTRHVDRFGLVDDLGGVVQDEEAEA